MGQCKVHGFARFTPPPRNAVSSFCTRCLSLRIEQDPESFLLTTNFKAALAEATQEGALSDNNIVLRRRVVETRLPRAES